MKPENEHENKPDFKQTFQSVGDFVDHVKSPVVLAPAYLGYDRGEWYGVDAEQKPHEVGGACVLRLVEQGWPEGARLMSEVDGGLYAPPTKSIRRRHKWSDQGDEINLQRVYSGNIEQAWTTTTKQLSSGPSRVRIIVDAISYGGEEAKTMRWRGIAAMKIADVLTQAGYTVQVESAFYGVGGGDNRRQYSGVRVLRVIVKPYAAPLDLESLAATTALPGFFRALGHAWAGGLMSVPQLRLEHVFDESDKAWAVIIPQSVKDARSASDQVEIVMKELTHLHEHATAEALV